MYQPDQRHIFSDLISLQRAAAEFFVQRAADSVQAHGRMSVCLAGGSTPEPIYRLLAQPPYRERVRWQSVHVFWGDERCVPPDHPDSNFRMAREALLDQVPIPPEQIYPIDGTLAPPQAATRYEARLRTFFGQSPPAFDLIWLGLGDDGHTASLFPHTEALTVQDRWVTEVFLPQKETFRISMTAPLISQADTVAFVVTGAAKASALQAVLEGPPQPREFPAQLIRPNGRPVHWFLDEAAAARLRPV